MSCCGPIAYLPTWLGGQEGPNFEEVSLKVRLSEEAARRDNVPFGTFKRNGLAAQNDLVLHYMLDRHSGELYARDGGNGPSDLRMKSFLITIFAAPYAAAVIVADLFRIIEAIVRVSIEAFGKLYCDYVKHGLCGATAEFFSTLGAGIRDKIWPLIREILMTPLALPLLEIGAVITLAFPGEGRVVIDVAQRFWFNGTFRKDNRYLSEHRDEAQESDGSPAVCFIAYCMMSRGNIQDQISSSLTPGGSMPKYERVRSHSSLARTTEHLEGVGSTKHLNRFATI
jgi:hypothetical protein